jgi:hypothetical protein
LENARAVLCLGYHAGTLHLSLRTKQLDRDAGLLIQEVIPEEGSAGGHGTMAGGQVLANPGQTRDLVRDMRTRFLALMGEAGTQGEMLLS